MLRSLHADYLSWGGLISGASEGADVGGRIQGEV